MEHSNDSRRSFLSFYNKLDLLYLSRIVLLISLQLSQLVNPTLIVIDLLVTLRFILQKVMSLKIREVKSRGFPSEKICIFDTDKRVTPFVKGKYGNFEKTPVCTNAELERSRRCQ